MHGRTGRTQLPYCLLMAETATHFPRVAKKHHRRHVGLNHQRLHCHLSPRWRLVIDWGQTQRKRTRLRALVGTHSLRALVGTAAVRTTNALTHIPPGPPPRPNTGTSEEIRNTSTIPQSIHSCACVADIAGRHLSSHSFCPCVCLRCLPGLRASFARNQLCSVKTQLVAARGAP